MMNLKIKKAEEKDISQIIALIQEFAEYENLSQYCEVTEEKLKSAMFGENPCVEGLIAFDGEIAVAYALFYPNFASFRGQRGLYLEDIYIRENYRKHGIGEAMLKYLARLAKERGCVRIDFQVLDWNMPAINFYKKHGAEMDASERHFKFTDEAFKKLAKE
jgi:GNAT superfamily N-acetyltransferase